MNCRRQGSSPSRWRAAPACRLIDEAVEAGVRCVTYLGRPQPAATHSSRRSPTAGRAMARRRRDVGYGGMLGRRALGYAAGLCSTFGLGLRRWRREESRFDGLVIAALFAEERGRREDEGGGPGGGGGGGGAAEGSVGWLTRVSGGGAPL